MGIFRPGSQNDQIETKKLAYVGFRILSTLGFIHVLNLAVSAYRPTTVNRIKADQSYSGFPNRWERVNY